MRLACVRAALVGELRSLPYARCYFVAPIDFKNSRTHSRRPSMYFVNSALPIHEFSSREGTGVEFSIFPVIEENQFDSGTLHRALWCAVCGLRALAVNWREPIFHVQARHFFKLAYIVGYQREPQCPGMRGDE